MKSTIFIVSLVFSVLLAGCNNSEAEKEAKKWDGYREAMLKKSKEAMPDRQK